MSSIIYSIHTLESFFFVPVSLSETFCKFCVIENKILRVGCLIISYQIMGAKNMLQHKEALKFADSKVGYLICDVM